MSINHTLIPIKALSDDSHRIQRCKINKILLITQLFVDGGMKWAIFYRCNPLQDYH